MYNNSYKVPPPTLSTSGDSLFSTNSSIPLRRSSVFRPQLIDAGLGVRLGGDYELSARDDGRRVMQQQPQQQQQQQQQPGGGGRKAPRRGGRGLPGAERNSDGAVHLAPAASSSDLTPGARRAHRARPRGRQKPHAGGRAGSKPTALPPVTRNSIGDPVVCAPHRRSPPAAAAAAADPADCSELTASSVIFEQIDDIYGRRWSGGGGGSSARRALGGGAATYSQYFGDGRPPPRPPTVTTTERDVGNEEDSVRYEIY